MATNPNGIFSAALAAGPHVEPLDVGQYMDRRALAQSQNLAIQTETQGAALQNQKMQRELEGDQALRDAIKNNTQMIPVGQPSSTFPAAQPTGTDDEGNPIYPPNYHAAMAASVAQAPLPDVNAIVREMNAKGHGDRALTYLQSYTNAQKAQSDLLKQNLENDQTRNAAIGDRLQGLLRLAKPQGADGPTDPDGLAQAQAAYPTLAQDLNEKYQANLPSTFDLSTLDARYRSHAGFDAILKQQKNAADILNTGAETKQHEAVAKEQAAQAEKTAEETKQIRISNAAAEEFVKNPGAELGAGGRIESLGLDPATTMRLKNQIFDIFYSHGSATEKYKAVLAAKQKAIDQANELAKETNPAKLDFDVRKAGAEAGARARAEASIFGGNSGTSQIADDVANYRIPFSQAVARLPGAAREAVLAQVKAINPNFNASQYDVAKKTEEAFTSGAPSKSANALNTVMGHLGELHDAADALKNGNIQVLNRIANSFGAQTGNNARTVYDAIVHKVGPELTTAYTASGGSVGERGTNEADFSSSLSPDQIKSNIGISVKLLDSKLKALQDQYQRGTYGRGQQQLLSDEAKATRDKLLSTQPKAPAGKIAVISPEGTPGFIDATKWPEAQKRGFTKP